MTPPGREPLRARIQTWMDGALDGQPPETFSDLALAIHAWQHAHDPLLQHRLPQPAITLDGIPPIPVDAFKQLPIGTVDPSRPHVVFRTSGTTSGARGEHRLHDTALYDHGALRWADRCVPHRPAATVALLPDPVRVPDSSLSHMVARMAHQGPVSWHLRDGVLDTDGLRRALGPSAPATFIATTAFALADWLDLSPAPLPAGSVLMVTGGFKGRRTSISDADLYEAARRALRPQRIVTEYGMTELSSQLWGAPGEPYRAPPWLRVLACDPDTGDALPPGQSGQLRFLDLANLDSALCVDTLDHGVCHADGGVTLLGRLPGAEARGCSLTVEEGRALRGDR